MINYSFIIPHKNSLNLLNRLINTIPIRDDIEIIIVDDNSVLTNIERKNFPGINRINTRIFFNKENKGAGHARNLGLKQATGKWLLFADADDYYSKGFINILDNVLDENLDILYFNVDVNFNWAFHINRKYEDFFNGAGDINDIKYIWNPWNKVFSRVFILENKIYFDEIPVGNDAMFCLKASNLAKHIKVINDKLYTYTSDNDNSITFQKMTLNRKISYLKINIRINKFFRETNNEKYCFLLISKGILCNMYKTYGLTGLIKYIHCLFSNHALINEILYLRKKYKK